MDYHITVSERGKLQNIVIVVKSKFETIETFRQVVKKIILEHELIKGTLKNKEAENYVQNIEDNGSMEYIFKIREKELIVYWA